MSKVIVERRPRRCLLRLQVYASVAVNYDEHGRQWRRLYFCLTLLPIPFSRSLVLLLTTRNSVRRLILRSILYTSACGREVLRLFVHCLSTRCVHNRYVVQFGFNISIISENFVHWAILPHNRFSLPYKTACWLSLKHWTSRNWTWYYSNNQ